MKNTTHELLQNRNLDLSVLVTDERLRAANVTIDMPGVKRPKVRKLKISRAALKTLAGTNGI